MIRSMTGFGKCQADLPGKVITVEIRALNSKQLDLNFRAPAVYREKEMIARTLITQKLERGKIDATITAESKNEQPAVTVNKAIALHYLEQLKDLSSALPQTQNIDYLSVLVRMPDVLKTEKEELSEHEWDAIRHAIETALEEADTFRKNEGKILENDFIMRINRITALLESIEPLEKARVATIRARLTSRLDELNLEKSFDENRLEQELIYYFEKLDITEEKLRLRKHCDFFILTLDEMESPGKKLSFITQEIGREINTLGSKANDASIQVIVVRMKDELEKIKEQLANIL
ncbi:MAG: YicC family protein [Bacteroidales bacterium]|nr:YicC family protein [Bacteroidales bacterium]